MLRPRSLVRRFQRRRKGTTQGLFGGSMASAMQCVADLQEEPSDQQWLMSGPTRQPWSSQQLFSIPIVEPYGCLASFGHANYRSRQPMKRVRALGLDDTRALARRLQHGAAQPGTIPRPTHVVAEAIAKTLPGVESLR